MKYKNILKNLAARIAKYEQMLEMRGIYSPVYNYANYKKNLDEYMTNKRSHKAFLRKHRLGKFAKCK